jgi:hypothetical protein
MSPTVLVLVLATALGGLGVVLNHAYARLALVELTLNEGLPPGLEQSASSAGRASGPANVDSGVHIFLSRSCHACQRLIEELAETTLVSDRPIHFRYLDRPRPIARSAADRSSATLVTSDVETARSLGADPLPYSVIVGDHGATSHGVTPTATQVIALARDAGVVIGMQS